MMATLARVLVDHEGMSTQTVGPLDAEVLYQTIAASVTRFVELRWGNV